MSEAREALKQARVAKDEPKPSKPLPPTSRQESAEYRRTVESINRATEREMERALAR